MIEEFERFKREANDKMDKAIAYLKDEYKRLKIGRASIAMVEDIKFDYYGNHSPVKQAATLSTPDPHTIVIDPWDKNVLHNIEKGISESNLGFNCSNDGRVIRVSIPPLTEERKKELVKYAKELAEEAKIVIRNERRDINSQVKKFSKEGHISEDAERKELDEIQKVTDDHNKNIDEIFDKKEKEIMEI
jgi:ribosome recycling factor